MLPLRIFEDRYRKMLSDVLKKERMFAIVAERERHPTDGTLEEPPFDVATIGLIRVSKKHEDGTSFVMLQGVSRIRIREIVRESPYRVVSGKVFDTIVEKGKPICRNKIIDALEQNNKLGGDVSKETLEYLIMVEDDSSFIDLAAFTLCKNSIRKQAMLEVQRLHKRAEMLFDDLIKENLKLSFEKNFPSDIAGKDLDRN
tara:strand:+ start:3282 stop:3881 length:600 start_codon:yes stop_codon:yes gene_type:complete